MSRGRKGNCDNCHVTVFMRRITIIPEWHYLKQSTEWQYLCPDCSVEFNVPMNKNRLMNRIKRNLPIPEIDKENNAVDVGKVG